MRHLMISLLLFTFINASSRAIDKVNSIDTSIHFYSVVDKTQFDTLKGSDFTWIIFQPINDTLSYTPFEKRPAFIEKLTNKQKALFYIWELERAVIGGSLGFANFYYNYKSYYPETIKSLRLINDTGMIKLLEAVNKIYLSKYEIITQKYKTEWKYIQKQFKFYDKAFIDKHEATMKLLEEYVRIHADEFVRFKN